MRQLTRSLDKLNDEVDEHILNDCEVIPRNLNDKDFHPNDICNVPILFYSEYDDFEQK